MKLPQTLQLKVLEKHHLDDFLLIEITPTGHVIDDQGNKNILPPIHVKNPIQSWIAGLETETFEEDFFIPFYHLNEKQVIDLHHYITAGRHHLILIPQNQIHQEFQSKQQSAFESQLRNQNLQTMFQA